MAKYLSPEAKKKRTRRRRMRRSAMFCCLAAFVLVVSWGIVSLIEAFSPGEEVPQDLVVTPPPESGMQSNDSLVSEGNWSEHVGPVKQTINEFEIIAPDHRMLQLPENGSVDLSYFEDACFVGDSLTDGLRIYTGIENSVANIAKFVCNKNLTPKSFIEGVIPFNWDRKTQNGIEAIVEEDPEILYITLGTNAMTFMTDEQFLYYYDQMLTQLQDQLPDSLFYVCSLTPTTQAAAAKRPIFSYDRLYNVNNQVAKLASEKGMHYINLHEVLAGDDGYLKPEYDSGLDGIHLKPEAYTYWVQYLMTHTVHDKDNPYIPGSPYYAG
ncbi:MAG: hypothetical protein IKU47_07800 [Oscillospiraceae bacterium]|nr:hypothetical protein [Oscillospiraceae bacterium]